MSIVFLPGHGSDEAHTVDLFTAFSFSNCITNELLHCRGAYTWLRNNLRLELGGLFFSTETDFVC